MNSLQIRKEAITLMQKLRGIYWSMISYLAFQNGESISMYPFLALSGPRGSGKSYEWIVKMM